MKKSLIFVVFVGLAALGNTQAMAAEGCQSMATEAVNQKIIDGSKKSSFISFCQSKSLNWYNQCAQICKDTGYFGGRTADPRVLIDAISFCEFGCQVMNARLRDN